MVVDLCMDIIYMLMLVLITLPLIQAHSGSTKAKKQCQWIILTTKQAIKHLTEHYITTVGLFFFFTWP